MTPVSFAGCFGWLHTAPLRSDTAIVICPGLSDDALTAHRPLRLLADQLATAGYPALRFDYRGTGDSIDLNPGEVEMTAWLASLCAACDAARIMTGARRLILCGFRFGASLAALVAAERTDITGLVLIDPILRGRSWLRQMTIEARLKRLSHGQEKAASPEDILPVSAETAAAINALDLRAAAFSTGIGILILPHIAGPALAECVSAWTARGAVVAQAPFAGLEPLLRPTFMNHECDADVSCILDWLPRLPADESASPTSGSAVNVFAVRQAKLALSNR
jgi:pimeloyl-ACP methyl ester carboxylesterase